MTGDWLDSAYRAAFGKTRGEAKQERVCVICKQHPTFSTEAGRREFDISGVCEPCFDELMNVDEGDEPPE